MYQEFYGLHELPFELTANSKFLFLTGRQREVLSILQYGLLSAKSLTLLVGDAGTGKTTLLRAALDSERCRDVNCVYLNNPMLTGRDFVIMLARQFQLGAEAGESKSILLERLEVKLRESRASGHVIALVVDEAQSLTTELLEEVRLLANIETPTDKLLPVILAGQPELAERLERPNLCQLKQRVALRCKLEPFELADTASYIASRIHTAGGVPGSMFSQEAVRLIHERSRGIPRVINVICDNALVSGMAVGHRRVERAMVAEVCQDLRLPGSSSVTAPSGEQAAYAPFQVAAAATEDPGADQLPEELAGEESSIPSRFNFRFRWKSSLMPSRSSAKVIE
jgi:general secretion pathway protein A